MRWWEGLAAVETPGPAGAPEHRLRWEDGRFSLLAHGDPEAEDALAALGGARCPCLDVLAAWEAQHERPAILHVGARSFGEPLVAPLATAAALEADVRRWRNHLADLRLDAGRRGDALALRRLDGLAGVPERVAARRLGFLHLLALPRELQLRLQASAAAARADAGDDEALVVPTATRAVPALVAAGWQGVMEDVVLGDPPGGGDGFPVPATWIARVWSRGLGCVDGRFVLDVTSVTAGGDCGVRWVVPGKPEVSFGVVQWEDGWRTT